MVRPVPEGFHRVTPYLVIRDATRAIEFYKKAFGAVELMRLEGPGGTTAHAEVRIGDSIIMLGEELPEMGFRSPQTLGGTPVSLMVYVENCDAFAARAVAAGIGIKRPIQDQFYGDRSGQFEDPFGHVWTVATHKEDVSMEEMQRRMAAMAQHGVGEPGRRAQQQQQ
jgi:PhnB protein